MTAGAIARMVVDERHITREIFNLSPISAQIKTPRR